ncbi:hypothetical protein [Trichlorobacter lovleyi]|uniref:hypothetical protein n=1 Tax=Trichlorobacter lovleyi TaxID=313985 RepID=UPI002480DEF5|nr:hypothetical protein [Trichlorobacter lovleyi]
MAGQQPSSQHQQAAHTQITAERLAEYASQIEQTNEALKAFLCNMDGLLDYSADGARQLLSLITDRYDFIVNDMNRELDGKRPLDRTRLEYLEFSEEYKQKYPQLFQAEGGVQ